jgi:ElaB/YqjD/DUF883 family membrane-anchored ribosome-binding protein
MEIAHMERANTDKLMKDLHLVVQDAEELLKATAGQAGEKVSAVRARAEESIRAAKARLAETGEHMVESTRAAAQVTDKYVHENPWTVVGVGAGLGFLIGYLIGRR